jgi:hypothetical protein
MPSARMDIPHVGDYETHSANFQENTIKGGVVPQCRTMTISVVAMTFRAPHSHQMSTGIGYASPMLARHLRISLRRREHFNSFATPNDRPPWTGVLGG